MYTKKKDIEKLLDLLERQPSITKCVQVDEESNVCEMRAEVAPGLGISIVGELNEEGNFEREYYFPYLESNVVGSTEECSVQRHTEKETYSGMVDENRVGITLIFYIQNFLDFREKMLDKEHHSRIGSVCFSGMSIGGKVLLPIKKSQKQIQKAKVSAKERSSLIEAAKNGDEDAMETLTIEDIDLYSQISRRAMKEDLYSIIDSCFMPCGVECDQYSIIGEIKEVEKSGEKVNIIDLTPQEIAALQESEFQMETKPTDEDLREELTTRLCTMDFSAEQMYEAKKALAIKMDLEYLLEYLKPETSIEEMKEKLEKYQSR